MAGRPRSLCNYVRPTPLRLIALARRGAGRVSALGLRRRGPALGLGVGAAELCGDGGYIEDVAPTHNQRRAVEPHRKLYFVVAAAGGSRVRLSDGLLSLLLLRRVFGADVWCRRARQAQRFRRGTKVREGCGDGDERQRVLSLGSQRLLVCAAMGQEEVELRLHRVGHEDLREEEFARMRERLTEFLVRQYLPGAALDLPQDIGELDELLLARNEDLKGDSLVGLCRVT
eukprot:342730-Pleurochrysis_carterae.AAC.1